jgi:hypothetical protein
VAGTFSWPRTTWVPIRVVLSALWTTGAGPMLTRNPQPECGWQPEAGDDARTCRRQQGCVTSGMTGQRSIIGTPKTEPVSLFEPSRRVMRGGPSDRNPPCVNVGSFAILAKAPQFRWPAGVR